MFSDLDPVFLARAQFAFTVAYHITFPAFTIGLASWLAVVEWRWLKTGNPLYEQIYRMWVKIFAVTFGMGVVTGVVLSYQFGTNWSVFADKVGNVLGPLLGFEVLTAFFLEASFLGIMLFGWNRVSKKMHFAATVIVAAGTLISAFWILSANSWMQTPTGFREGADGLLYPTDWIAGDFQPVLSLPSGPHGYRGIPYHGFCGGRHRRVLPVAGAAREARPDHAGHGHDHGHIRCAHAAILSVICTG